jgi:hypothetical protein
MPLFRVVDPFVTYRVFLVLGTEGESIAEQLGCLWDNNKKMWYLNEDKYKESEIYNSQELKSKYTPFKGYGAHQHFL